MPIVVKYYIGVSFVGLVLFNMKSLRNAMAECFELAAKHGITSHLLWHRSKQEWFVSILIIPMVHNYYDVIKTFEVSSYGKKIY